MKKLALVAAAVAATALTLAMAGTAVAAPGPLDSTDNHSVQRDDW
jgi:lipase chaperone LimK